MTKRSNVIRTSFADIEYEDVTFLMQELRVLTPHDLVRRLVSDRAQEIRAAQMRYGSPSAKAPRETKAQRRAKLDAMSDPELTLELKKLGAIEDADYGNGNATYAEVGIDATGTRRILFWNVSGIGTDREERTEGGTGETVEQILNKLERKGNL